MTSKMYDPDYWLCKRCNSYKPKDEFFGVTPYGKKREYKLCVECRKPHQKYKGGITRAEHERRKAERIARRAGETG